MENICTYCDREFKTRPALISHLKSHNPEHEGRFEESSEPWAAPEPQPTPRFDFIPEDDHLELSVTPDVVRLRKLPNYGNLPEIAKQTAGSAGYDLYAAIPERFCIGVGERRQVPTGLSIELPVSMVGLVCPRSGLAWKNGISLVNTPGIIDSDYRGEIVCIVINHSNTKFWVEPGMRIAQLVISVVPQVQIEYVNELSDTSRGAGGFGSTGTK